MYKPCRLKKTALCLSMAYYTSRPDSLLDVFQLRYFEVTVILDIQNLCQTIKIKFCLAGSEKMHQYKGEFQVPLKKCFFLNRMFPYYAIQSKIGIYHDLNYIYLCLKFQTSSPKNGRDIEENVLNTLFLPIFATPYEK